jgi:hypothetical protein
MPRHCTFLRSMEIIQFFAGCQNNSIFLAGNCHDKIQSNFNERWAGGPTGDYKKRFSQITKVVECTNSVKL